MPELPEVETTKRGITPHIINQTISDVVVRESRFRWPVPNDITAQLKGQAIRDIQRRAKYLLFKLDNGYFMLHLGMSGSLRICINNQPLRKHDHVIFHFPKLTLRFNDPRRFGSLLWLGNNPYQHELLKSLGPEPFDPEFNADYLFSRSRKRKVAIKNFIMDNSIVVGVGNIYANEALFLTGIRPRTAARRITRKQFEQLIINIKQILSASIEMGGSTLRDFVGGDGKPGYFQQTLRVYNKTGQACLQCKTPIKHIVVGQRGTFYCPQCQR